MSNNQAGKGDKPRPVIKKVYDINFDQIDWKNKNSTPKTQTKVKNKIVYKY